MAHRAPKPPTPGPGASSVQAPRRFLLKDNEPSWLLLAQAKDSLLTRDGHWHRVARRVGLRVALASTSAAPRQVRLGIGLPSDLQQAGCRWSRLRAGFASPSRRLGPHWQPVRGSRPWTQRDPGIGSIAAVPGRPRSQVVSAAAAAERTLTDSVVAVCIEVCLLRPSRRLLSSSDRAPCC